MSNTATPTAPVAPADGTIRPAPRRRGRPIKVNLEEHEQMYLRVPKELSTWLRSRAVRERRSITAQAIYVLEQAKNIGA